MSEAKVINLEQYKYIHVLDTMTNATRLEVGPQKFVQRDHEVIVTSILNFINLKPRHYCIIKNPVIRQNKEVVMTKFPNGAKFAAVRFGDQEIRLQENYQEPFPLHPYEELELKATEYKKVNQNCALVLKTVRPFYDEKAEVERFVNDEYLFIGGAGAYIPRIEEEIVKEIKFKVIKPQTAIVVKANKDLIDCEGKKRIAGQRWLVRNQGTYQQDVNEEVQETRKATILTDKKSIRLRALKDMEDVYGIKRAAGDEWLVGIDQTAAHILDVNEEFVEEAHIISLSNRQYCYIWHPVINGVQHFGVRQLVKGEKQFFLQPFEQLENDRVNDVVVLGEEQALLLKALYDHIKEDNKAVKAGEVWMKVGPCDYIPPIEVQQVELRQCFTLDKNEGFYVRDKRSGEVRLMKGSDQQKEKARVLIAAHEELWEKELPEVVEKLISEGQDQMEFEKLKKVVPKKRDKSLAVTFKAVKGTAVQLFDYKSSKTRIVFGPELIMLDPYEDITVIPLSGGFPITEAYIRSLSLELGPSMIRDQIIVETVDHAKLIMDLSYNWEFIFDRENPVEERKIFQTRDYVGNACKAMLSRIRGVISNKTFDDFHKGSHTIIKSQILKADKGRITPFKFPENNFFITDINSSGYRPVDKETDESLQRSFKLSLDIQTKSKEAEAKHQQEQLEQQAKGLLDLQKINHEKNKLEATKLLLEQEAETEFLKKQETDIANARAKAEARIIEGQGLVSQAQNKVTALNIRRKQEIELKQSRMNTELDHQRALNDLEVKTAEELASIEVKKFKETIDAIGKDTIVKMAKAGPETQAKMLKGLGLEGFMILDGKHPVNLFNTAKGMLGDSMMSTAAHTKI